MLTVHTVGAFGRHVREDSLEVVGPRVNDLLPDTKRGQPTGRPAATPCDDGTDAQSIMLELRSTPAMARNRKTVSARL